MPPGAPVSERRLVSVLFADLVGFTSLSESLDAEEVRDLLSGYFEICRRLIGRYGGTVEKFIGDAVMAVWGTPLAQEDDAERAVRAALELVQAVTDLGLQVGAPDLRARAGVLTGEAAVTLGAEGQGMVAGDLVNTASRIQSASDPGAVLVGEETRRVTEAAVHYEDTGEHTLKGKAEPVRLWRAVRVVAGARGALRSPGLEAPFVGRDRELRLVKDLFHTTAEDRRANLISVIGMGGIGKTRLSWEFEKYVEGLAIASLWHRGRCLSYGEGVAYWALADMVKMRCRIAEEDDTSSAMAKLRATIDEFVADPEERRWVEPRLAHLLGLEGSTGDQENLFSAWRIFFERLAARFPVVMVFEDMQWADDGLLDFIEYLLEWSRTLPLFVMALARPELADRRPAWGVAKRAFASLYLEPLPEPAMDKLLSGLVPGLPEDLRTRILDRAEGVPMYAVETVRMLLDRRLVAREGSVYRLTGPIESLEVPGSLHALIAARLDGLTPTERRVVQDGAVLGKTFFEQGVAKVSGLPLEELTSALAGLVRKEMLSLQADPRSPERGQYAFLQDLVRRVAYETLSKKERKARHLAAAAYIEDAWADEEDEVEEILASHYLSAYEAAPDAADAAEIRTKARVRLELAGERAASLAAPAEAKRYFDQAARLVDDPLKEAALLERAGLQARAAAEIEETERYFQRAQRLFEERGATNPSARMSARLADVMWDRGRIREGLEAMDHALMVLSTEPNEDFAALAAQVGRFRFFAGDVKAAMERVEAALGIAEALDLPETLSQAINTKGLIMNAMGRASVALALIRHALGVALASDIPSAALRAYNNLADLTAQHDRYRESKELATAGLALARRVGNRYWEQLLLGLMYPTFALGEWNDTNELMESLPLDLLADSRAAFAQGYVTFGAAIRAHRGQIEEADRLLLAFDVQRGSDDLQEVAEHASGRAIVLRAKMKYREAIEAAEAAIRCRDALGFADPHVKESLVIAIDSALDVGDREKAEELLGLINDLPAGLKPRFLRAQELRCRAKLAERTKDPGVVGERFEQAIGLFREIEMPFYLAISSLEFGAWLTTQGQAIAAEPLLTEAREIFEGLGARPWLDRLERSATGPVG
jgi:class 3 adenylate cyclase/tetratricopeptide (TPR) repeat protein